LEKDVMTQSVINRGWKLLNELDDETLKRIFKPQTVNTIDDINDKLKQASVKDMYHKYVDVISEVGDV